MNRGMIWNTIKTILHINWTVSDEKNSVKRKNPTTLWKDMILCLKTHWQIEIWFLELVMFYLEDGLEMALSWWHWGRNPAHPLFRSSGREDLQEVSLILLCKRMSWKGHFSVTLEKASHNYCPGLPGDRACEQVVLLRKWSWKGHSLVTLGKPLHLHCWALMWDRPSVSWYDILLERWSWKGHW